MSYTIKGAYATAKVYAREDDEHCNEQIKEICDKEFLAHEKIRIMPDCHYGYSVCIGFTCTMKTQWAVPNYIGVDIGCGVLAHPIGALEHIDFKKFDNYIRRYIPSGFKIHTNPIDYDRYQDIYANISDTPMTHFFDELHQLCHKHNITFRADNIIEQSIGSLGGGNHFIALNKNKSDEVYITIHSGSRNFGLQIANHFQKKVGESGYLSGDLYKDYIYAMGLAQKYAQFNRMVMLHTLLGFFDTKLDKDKLIESVHNYIDLENNIIRKGAISANAGQLCLIPINMADGVLLCRGKGNPDWNYSAPHGAGRLFSRTHANKELNMDEYQRQMTEKNVWSSCISTATLDESPMAYKSYEYLLEFIADTVDIVDHWAEIYNFKAAN